MDIYHVKFLFIYENKQMWSEHFDFNTDLKFAFFIMK